ncbi:ribonuclease H [Lentinula aciculospora]|uniref:Ribonuclease H n=1 Tax=Lentinula aciculospora TaxID=153920 RepID=A0A9W9DXL4_9AGAR|nr:ribonuclease H [Lentinula aciculospora]
MKRSTASVPSSPATQKNKKAKLSPNASENEGTISANQGKADVGWTKVEKRKKKKVHKAEVKLDTTQPKFMYSNNDILQRQRAIGVEEVRDLALHIIADAPPPNWLRVENAQMIPKVVVILVPGLTPDVLGIPPPPTSALRNPNLPISIPLPPRRDPSDPTPTGVPFIGSTFSHACPTRAPGDQTKMHSVLSTFFNLPISGAEKKRRLEAQAKAKVKSSESGLPNPSEYILTIEQMIDNDYPIPSYMADVDNERSPDWVETPQEPKLDGEQGKPMPRRKVFGIDCEMCTTEDGKELTRVCMIDYDTQLVVYDQLVKPKKPVIDYLTRWSGITAEALATATTTFAEAQAHILKLLNPVSPHTPKPNPFSTKPTPSFSTPQLTPILLGHSLESDLKALKIAHSFCVDTALIYSHPRGRPFKPGLAWLTKKWCGREIQARGEGGHDPEEDARATMELVRKKVENGPEFGEFKADLEGLFERMGRAVKRSSMSIVNAGTGGEKIRTAVIDHGNPSVMHGNKASTSSGCKDDEEVVSKTVELVGSHDFVFVRLMGLANVRGWITPRANPSESISTSIPAASLLADPPTPEALSSALLATSNHLQRIHASLPSRTALLIFTGHSDPRKMSELNKRKAAFEAAIWKEVPTDQLSEGERWSGADMRELEEAVEVAKRGLLFLGVKA